MDQVVYVCTGTCQAVISEEEYKNGLTHCGTGGCSMKGQPFEKRLKCSVCGQLYKQSLEAGTTKEGEPHPHS